MASKKGKKEEEAPELLLPEPIVKQADMPLEMRKEAFEAAKIALTTCEISKDQATYIKKYFDSKFATSWHCVVGKTYGVSIAHATKYLLFFTIGKVHILLFKSYE